MQKIIKYLGYIIYYSIIFLPFSISIAPALTNILIGFLIFSFIFKKIIKREKLFIHTAINLPFCLLVLLSIISFKNSIDYTASFRGLAKLAQNAFIFFACAEEIRDKKHIRLIFMFIVLGAFLASLDALWQINFGKDFIRGHIPIINIGLKRATAAFPNANILGVYLSAIIPLVIGMTLYYFKGLKKAIMFIPSLLGVIGIGLTFSRGTVLGLYISLLFLSIMHKNKLFSVLLLVVLLAFPFIMPKNIKDYAKSVNYNPIIFMCNTDRISIYRNTLNMIKHHPLIGVGVNTFSKNYLKYKLPEPADAKTGDAVYAHNIFLHMAGEIGLLGLGVFLWLLVALFKKCIYIYNSVSDHYLKIISVSLLACFISFLVNGLTETSLYYARVAIIFWYLIGLGLSLKKFTS